MRELNAIIQNVSLSSADHGCLSGWLHLEHAEGSQGFGGWDLYSPYKHENNRKTAAGHFIWRCLEIGGVTEWNKLVGKTVRVRIVDGRIEAIGHVIKDEWFVPRREMENF